MRPIVCMITPAVSAEHIGTLVAPIEEGARAGLDLVQIRQPHLDARILLNLVRKAVDAVRGSVTRVVVNERVDVAIASGAHGVHLREDSIAASRVRPAVPRQFLIGRSVHSVDAVRHAAAGPLDYLLFGTVFATSSKPGVAPAGTGLLAEAAAATPLPLLAIGGVTREHVAAVARTGAAGIAAIGLFTDNVAEAVADVRRLWPAS